MSKQRLKDSEQLAILQIFLYMLMVEKLDEFIDELTGGHQFRVFTGRVSVLERPLTEKAGLGWKGRSSMLINKVNGSFFLSE